MGKFENPPNPEKIFATEKSKETIYELVAKILKLDPENASTGKIFSLTDGGEAHIFGRLKNRGAKGGLDDFPVCEINLYHDLESGKSTREKFVLSAGGKLEKFFHIIELDKFDPETGALANDLLAEEDAEQRAEKAATELGFSSVTEAEAQKLIGILRELESNK